MRFQGRCHARGFQQRSVNGISRNFGENMRRITFVLGGARSGKSSYALKLAEGAVGPLYFIATAEAFDEEMKLMISNHRQERNQKFVTIESPLELSKAIKLVGSLQGSLAIIDCLTVWLGNLFHYEKEDKKKIQDAIDALLCSIEVVDCNLIFVANEVGLGLVPETELGRNFRDVAGRLNQAIAGLADSVFLCVAGIPMAIKH